jgi:hypothetical protein
MRTWVYATLLSYVAVTTAAAFWNRWAGHSGQRFLAALGDMLAVATVWLPGGGSVLLVLGIRWLTVGSAGSSSCGVSNCLSASVRHGPESLLSGSAC